MSSILIAFVLFYHCWLNELAKTLALNVHIELVAVNVNSLKLGKISGVLQQLRQVFIVSLNEGPFAINFNNAWDIVIPICRHCKEQQINFEYFHFDILSW